MLRLPNRTRGPLALALACLLLALPVGIVSFKLLTGFYLAQTADRADNTLGLAVSALQGQLDRYRNLPLLLAADDEIRALVSTPDPVAIETVNAYLKATSALLETSDIYVMGDDGTTLAASNFDRSASFVGENFDYRPYFTDAIKGGLGSFFALGTTSLKRGYYFSAPIRNGENIDGVLTIKVDIDAIERTWRASDTDVIVTDPEGIIFMSSRPGWLFSSLEPLVEERLERTSATRRYADAELVELPISLSAIPGSHSLLAFIDGDPAPEYVSVAEDMTEAGWTVRVLVDASSARAETLISGALIVLSMGLATMAGVIWLQRRQQLAERLALQQDARDQLEQRVVERTADLARVNVKLEAEIQERSHAEAMLRKTQSDLVQAGKLAALGQMSAALSHEFNQPLAAVRSYAESALIMIDRDRTKDTRQYIERIGKLTEKMATISRHLSNFARQPGESLRSVSLATVLADALAILDWRVREQQIEIIIDLDQSLPMVRAGDVRLQQVLVNILSNAFDAVEDRSVRIVSISARPAREQIALSVTDSGPGVPKGVITRIFDPFFSTKGVGRGLGLGLSISYNIVKDFGGDLQARNISGSGAEFTILLDPAEETVAEPAQ